MLDGIIRLLFLTTAAIAAGIAVSIPAWVVDLDTSLALPVRGVALGYAVFVFGAVMIDRP